MHGERFGRVGMIERYMKNWEGWRLLLDTWRDGERCGRLVGMERGVGEWARFKDVPVLHKLFHKIQRYST